MSKRKLLKSSFGYRSTSLPPTKYPPFVKACFVVAFGWILYINYRINVSVGTLPTYPQERGGKQFNHQELGRFGQKPTIGAFTYSSLATIYFPTCDLEESSYSTGVLPSYNDDVVVLTRKGYKHDPEDGKRSPNQDRVLVLSKNDGGQNNGNSDWWMGLFDGHGYYGHAVSEYVSSEFVRRIHQEWEKDSGNVSTDEVKNTVRNIFLDINQSVPKPISTSGCTGMSVFKRGNLLYISNVGDSVAFVASFDKKSSESNIIYSTTPHKPDTPSEKARIEAVGGKVVDPIMEGNVPRLMIPVKYGSQVVEIGLAMSRALGDHNGLPVGLSAEPDTDVLDLAQLDKSKEYIVVAATDGLIDDHQLSKSEVALDIGLALSTNKATSRSGVETASILINKASVLWGEDYRDDISIVAHKLRI